MFAIATIFAAESEQKSTDLAVSDGATSSDDDYAEERRVF